MIRIRLMPAIVLNVETNSGDRQPNHDGQRHYGPPARCDEDKQEVSRGEPCDDRRGLKIHLEIIALAATGLLEIRINAVAQLADKTVAAGEFNRGRPNSSGGRGRCWGR